MNTHKQPSSFHARAVVERLITEMEPEAARLVVANERRTEI
ncbi:hypothetical protein IWQ48_003843 [Labrenzia sp. EL_13]|nr:hypothetical protein [Labrenzia sp. EL_13]